MGCTVAVAAYGLSPGASSRGYSSYGARAPLSAEHGLSDVWASVVAARRLQQLWLVGLLPCSVCDLRGSGMEPVSPV